MKLRNLILSVFATTLFVAVPAQAQWDAIFSCNNGDFVVDQNSGSYQVVLRRAALDHFKAANLVLPYDINAKGELVLNVFRQGSSFVAGRMIQQGAQIKYTVHRNGNYAVLSADLDNRAHVNWSGPGSAEFKFYGCWTR